MQRRCVRIWFGAILVAVSVGPLTAPPAASLAAPAVTVARNFYPPEVWEPGKERRWMSNAGEIEVSGDAGAEMNLRFVAESFHSSRELRIFVDGTVAMIVLVPPAASRYIVVKHLRVPAGKIVLRFEASPGPSRVDELISSSDTREISIAFGPFSTVPSDSPEGEIEQTGAFPEWNSRLSIYTPDEDAANDLRRQGRMTEALAKYRAVIQAGAANQLSYVFAGLCALIVGAPDEAQSLFRSSKQGGGSSVVRSYAAKAAAQFDEFISRSELIHRPDPLSGLRTKGEIYRAVPEYIAAARAHPDDAVAHLWLGIIYAAAERLAEARTRFDRLIQAAPNTYDAQFLRNFLKSATTP